MNESTDKSLKHLKARASRIRSETYYIILLFVSLPSCHTISRAPGMSEPKILEIRYFGDDPLFPEPRFTESIREVKLRATFAQSNL